VKKKKRPCIVKTEPVTSPIGEVGLRAEKNAGSFQKGQGTSLLASTTKFRHSQNAKGVVPFPSGPLKRRLGPCSCAPSVWGEGKRA